MAVVIRTRWQAQLLPGCQHVKLVVIFSNLNFEFMFLTRDSIIRHTSNKVSDGW